MLCLPIVRFLNLTIGGQFRVCGDSSIKTFLSSIDAAGFALLHIAIRLSCDINLTCEHIDKTARRAIPNFIGKVPDICQVNGKTGQIIDSMLNGTLIYLTLELYNL